LGRGLARLQQTLRDFGRHAFQRGEAVSLELAAMFDLQAGEIDRAHHEDTGDTEQQNLPAQAKVQAAEEAAGEIHGIPNQSLAQRVHPELAGMRKKAIAVKIAE
jgi:hypothetical protein